jgi:hypothetical protein
MRIWAWLFGAVILAAAGQAHAQLSGFCVGMAKDGRAFVTPVMDLPQSSVTDEFDEWLAAQIKVPISDSGGNCWGFETRAEADQERTSDLNHKYGSGVNVTLISGFAPRAAAPSRATSTATSPSPSSRPGTSPPSSKSAGSGGYLTVITDTSLIEAGKKQEALELQAQRDEAASLAKRIADTARDRADVQAKLSKLFEEMRKRGSAQ